MDKIILTENRNDGEWLKKALRKSSDSLRLIENVSKEQIINHSSEYKGITYLFSTWNMPFLSEQEIKSYLPNLKCVYYIAGSTDYFIEPFKNCGIDVVSAIDENSIPVAEFVVAQIILANKGVFEAQRCYKKPFWRLSFKRSRQYSFCRKGNYKAKIGLIGLGRVGLKVLELLKPYDFELVVCDPKVSLTEARSMGANKSDLFQLFEKCDVISNHLPDLPSTKNILSFKLFSAMKENAVFINTGRGAQVVEKDLVKAMRLKPKATALLDVTRREPLLPWSSLLWTDNVFVTPHIAGSQSSEYQRMVHAVIQVYHMHIKHRLDFD